MARARSDDDGYDDYEEDENEFRPRRRRSRRDPDFEDDDAPPPVGPLDKMYGETSMVLLVMFGCCCGMLAMILSIIAYVTGRDEKAKSNAMVVIVLSVLSVAFWIAVQVAAEIAKGD